MCCWLLLLAIGSACLEPAPAILFELTNNSVHNDETTLGDGVWTVEEDATDPDTPYGIANETLESGPGAACEQSSDCASPLACLASKSCGCPERAPVLVREKASFACWTPRRLSEPCLTHAECSHGNEHAWCLDSVCQCPPSFRSAEAASLCLPDSQPVGWSPQHTSTIVAALLSLAFAIFGLIGYRRLLKSRAGKNEQWCVAWSRRTEFSSVPYERFSESVQSPPSKAEHSGAAFSSPWLREMSFGEAESQSYIQPGYEAPQMSRATYFTVASEGALQRRSTSTADYIEPVSTWNYSRNQLHRASSAPRNTLSQNIPFSTGLEELNSDTLKTAIAGSTASPASTINSESGDKPSPKRRTKISTLSTHTLKPCRRPGNVGVDLNPGPSAVGTFTAGIAAGRRLRAGLTSVPEEAGENDAIHFVGTSTSQTKPRESVKFTESELKGAPLKKFKSERLRTSSPKRPRRALSDTRDPLAVIADDHASDRSALDTSSRTTCVVSSGTNSEYSGYYYYEWPVESYVTLYDRHNQEGVTRWPLLTASQPTGPFGGAVWKMPGHVTRTFGAFALHDGCPLPAIKPRMTAPVKASLMGPTPVLPEPGWKRLPHILGDARRLPRRALRHSTASSRPQSAVTRTSTRMGRTLTSAHRCIRSTNKPPGCRVISPTASRMGRPCRSSPQAITAPRLQHFDRASQTVDVGRIASSGSFRSFSSTGSDGSNLPLSASTIVESSRPGTSEPSGSAQ